MAKDKKSVLLYCDIIHTVEELDDVDAGLLFKHYLRYINDQNPEPPSKLIKIVFEPIKQNLKRDLKKWESKQEKFSQAGTKSAALRNKNPQLYVVKIYDDSECFLKIGITDESISRRFSGKLKNYKLDVIHQYFNDTLINLNLESSIREKFRSQQYTPRSEFPGHTECYNFNQLENIIKHITTFNHLEAPSTFSTVNVKDIVTVKDTVTVTDKVTVNDTVTEKKKEDPLRAFLDLLSGDLKIAYAEWIQYRKELGKKITPSTAKKQIMFLGGRDPAVSVAIINQSISNGWTGLFELKQNGTTKTSKQEQSTATAEYLAKHYRDKLAGKQL